MTEHDNENTPSVDAQRIRQWESAPLPALIAECIALAINEQAIHPAPCRCEECAPFRESARIAQSTAGLIDSADWKAPAVGARTASNGRTFKPDRPVDPLAARCGDLRADLIARGFAPDEAFQLIQHLVHAGTF